MYKNYCKFIFSTKYSESTIGDLFTACAVESRHQVGLPFVSVSFRVANLGCFPAVRVQGMIFSSYINN